MSMYTQDDIEKSKFEANLQLQLEQMTERYKMAKLDNIKRAHERAIICQQLNRLGLTLHGNGNISWDGLK